MIAGNPSRRAVFAGMATVPVVGGLAVSPALSAGPTPFAIIYARHAAALEHFNNLPEPRSHEQSNADAAAYCAASVALDHAEPTNWTEFTQKVEHVLNDQEDELYTRLIADAKRLLAVGS